MAVTPVDENGEISPQALDKRKLLYYNEIQAFISNERIGGK